jgi:hypothetical protein
MSSQWYVKGNSLIAEVAKKASYSFDQEDLEHPVSVSPAYLAITPPPFPHHPRSLSTIDGHFKGSLTEKQYVHI